MTDYSNLKKHELEELFKNLTFGEYKKIVYNECLKNPVTEKYREDFENVFEGSEETLKKDFETHHSIADTVWGICLLV